MPARVMINLLHAAPDPNWVWHPCSWAIPWKFRSFYLTLGQQVVFQKLELQESPLSPLMLPAGQTPDTGGNWTPDLSGEKSALYHWAILTTLHSCVYTRITTLLIIVIHKVGTFEWTRPGTWTLPKNIWYGVLTLTVHVIRGILPSQFTSP